MNRTRNIIIDSSLTLPMEEQSLELVERKGTGHPDTMCDSIMEEVCRDLCREYRNACGHICHHNIDKGLLVAGRSLPVPGGGTMLEPMKIVFGDRATYTCDQRIIPVGEIAEASAKRWIREHLRYVDPDRHLIFQNEIKPGSPELTDAFSRGTIVANDTSVGVGYAPLSETERLVLATERHLNSAQLKTRHPEIGEDVKLMGYRYGKELSLTVAIAFVDRHVPDAAAYFSMKTELQQELEGFIRERLRGISQVNISINTLDDPSRGNGGMYLTVLGTSAEGGDGGQVGRGNRVNGLIPFNRPQTTEAAAGKNPVNHVGKIYNILSHEIAGRIHREVEGVREATIYLCSQIGNPVERPMVATAQLSLDPGMTLEKAGRHASGIIEEELDGICGFSGLLADGYYPVC